MALWHKGYIHLLGNVVNKHGKTCFKIKDVEVYWGTERGMLEDSVYVTTSVEVSASPCPGGVRLTGFLAATDLRFFFYFFCLDCAHLVPIPL